MTYNFSAKKPLLHFSEKEERASFFDTEELNSSMPRKKRSARGAKKRQGRSVKGIKFSKGRLALRLKGYKGLQKLAPAQLVRHIPLARLKQAARKVLSKFGKEKKVRRRKGAKKGKRSKQQ